MPESSDQVLAVAGRLYAGLPADFTPERTAAEKQAKAAGDKELAAALKALRKPSVGAWAVNLLVRREAAQIDQVLTLAASLRTAAEALDGAELRALTKQRRQLTIALTTRARQLALEHGTRLTPAVGDQVEATLTAAMLDAAAAEAVRSGLLVTTLAATGLGGDDFAAAVAVPEAIGTVAEPLAAPDGAPALHVVPENRAVLREAARDRLAAADEELATALRRAAKATKALTTLQSRRLQLGTELDELQRRVAETEQALVDLDDAEEAAESEEAEAAEARDAAQDARDAAQESLDSL